MFLQLWLSLHISQGNGNAHRQPVRKLILFSFALRFAKLGLKAVTYLGARIDGVADVKAAGAVQQHSVEQVALARAIHARY